MSSVAHKSCTIRRIAEMQRLWHTIHHRKSSSDAPPPSMPAIGYIGCRSQEMLARRWFLIFRNLLLRVSILFRLLCRPSQREVSSWLPVGNNWSSLHCSIREYYSLSTPAVPYHCNHSILSLTLFRSLLPVRYGKAVVGKCWASVNICHFPAAGFSYWLLWLLLLLCCYN